jgi:NAD(P)H dehydrogenase (quinone)
MIKVLVLYYSMYGHVERMAEAVADGARTAEGVEVDVKRVPEIMAEDMARAMGVKVDQPAPIAVVDELGGYDAIIFGTPTRFGNMAAQMRYFLDQTSKLWMEGTLIGKVASVFTSTSTQHGGGETTVTSFHLTLLHHGMMIVGVPNSCKGLSVISEVSGGSPYGASTMSGFDGKRMPTENELDIARFQGKHVAQIAKRMTPT